MTTSEKQIAIRIENSSLRKCKGVKPLDCLARVTARIQVLITAAQDMQERLPKDEQYLHASDIEATLQDLLYLARGRKPVLEET